MGSVVETKALWVKPPYGDGTNDTNVLRFTATTTAASDAMPNGWLGGYVTMKAIGGDVYWFFSDQSSVKVDSTKPAAADGGADPQLGWLLRDGEVMDVVVPKFSQLGDETVIYFSRQADNDTTEVWMRKSSD